MADKLIRDELLESDRWLDLPSDTHRLVFAPCLLLLTDDLGNLEGGRRLYRYVAQRTQIKSEADFWKLMSDLQDCDLVRRYEVGDKEYWHLPRGRPHRQYLVQRCPSSPWDKAVVLGKTQRIERRGKAKDQEVTESSSNDVVTMSQTIGNDVGQGVGVGEDLPSREISTENRSGVRAEKNLGAAPPETPKNQTPKRKRATQLLADWKLPKTWGEWALKEKPDWTPDRVRKTAELFADHWRAKGTARLDWEATWRNWVRREEQFGPRESSASCRYDGALL